MKRLLITVISLFIGACIVIIGAIFVLSKYAYQVEEKTGLVTHSQEDEFQQAPQESRTNAQLDIFAPPNNYVSSNQRVILTGKTTATWIVASHNDTFLGNVPMGKDGKFSIPVTLLPSVNQLTITGKNSEGILFTKELILGYMPHATGNQRAYLGEIMAIQEHSVNIVTATDTLGMNLGKAKLVRIQNKQTTPLAFSDLAITQRLGVISARLADNSGAPILGQVSLFPYTFSGKVVEKTPQSILVERWTNGPKSTALKLPTTGIYQRTGTKISYDTLTVGDMVVVNGFLIPGENRSQFHANFIVRAN